MKKKKYLIRIMGGEVFTVELSTAKLTRKELKKKKLLELVKQEFDDEYVKKFSRDIKMRKIKEELREYGEWKTEVLVDYIVYDGDLVYHTTEKALRKGKYVELVKERDPWEGGFYYVKRYYNKNGECIKELEICPVLIGLEIYEILED